MRIKLVLAFVIGVLLALAIAVWFISKRIETNIVEEYMSHSNLGFNQLETIHPSELDTNGLWVFFTFGQSNAGNYGQVRTKAENEVYNFYRGKLVVAADPLWGATGTGGSPWILMAEELIDKGFCKRVVIVANAVGGTEIKQWSRGYLSAFLDKRLGELKDAGLIPDYICWHQGEQDNLINTSKREYMHEFGILYEKVQKVFPDSPWLVGIATYNFDVESIALEQGISKEIREAQLEIIQAYRNVFAGPDTDMLNKAYQRFDGFHFSGPAMQQVAKMWVNSIEQVEK